jgi:ribonuclease P protein component
LIPKPVITKLYSLGKKERLKSHKIITKLFKEGQSFSNFPFRVLFLLHSDIEHSLQAGFSVGSKHFKKAVDRNRIKRLLREAYRKQKTELESVLKNNRQQISVFFIYTGRELPDYPLIMEKMTGTLGTLIAKINAIHLKNK